MSLVLRELESSDEDAFHQGLQEWKGENLNWFSFDWEPGLPFPKLLERLRKNRDDVDLPEHIVPSTMLYAFESDAESVARSRIVGRLNIRHRLNETLQRRGGHVGYAVAPRFRGRGVATEIMRQGLDHCRALQLHRILVTCSDTNIASWKVIEKFNAQLEGTAHDPDVHDELIRRYWIGLVQ